MRRARLIPARAGRTRSGTRRSRAWTAHPRSRGADPICTCPMTVGDGSSPLARGGPGRVAPVWLARGLIPARAGRTRYGLAGEGPWRAHPRSRGADQGMDGGRQAHRGSSPLARGGPLHLRHDRADRRLIPARAGRTADAGRVSCHIGAHPRSRGADTHTVMTSPVSSGSSPLARGGPDHDQRRHEQLRLIPARAGRTLALLGRGSLNRAHPRSRGADEFREVPADPM